MQPLQVQTSEPAHDATFHAVFGDTFAAEDAWNETPPPDYTRFAPHPPQLPSCTSLGPLGVFAELWLARRIDRGDLAPSTARRYAEAFERLSIPLARTPIEAVTPDLVEHWLMTARKVGFSPTTVNSWLRVLRTLYNDGMVRRFVQMNPAEFVRALRETPDLENRRPLGARELLAVLRALESLDFVICEAAHLQAFTGMRWGEVAALEWSDWDEAMGVLYVRRSLSDGQLMATTKTHKGRVVGIAPVAGRRLARYRERTATEPRPGLECGLMFPSRRGTPLRTPAISLALRRARAAAGVTQRFTSHGFRRSMTDLLRQAGVDPVVAAAIIGHDTTRMRQHYSSVRPSEAREAARRAVEVLNAEAASTSDATASGPSAAQAHGTAST